MTLIGGEIGIHPPRGRSTTCLENPRRTRPKHNRVPSPVQQLQGSPVATSESPQSVPVTIVGKISGKGTVRISGRIEGELYASTVLIDDGAQVEGDIVAEELTIGGRVKGTIHAHRVKLIGSAVVEGDIFHRSLSIDENARFEGSSRREETAMEEVGGKSSLLEDFSVSAVAARSG